MTGPLVRKPPYPLPLTFPASLHPSISLLKLSVLSLCKLFVTAYKGLTSLPLCQVTVFGLAYWTLRSEYCLLGGVYMLTIPEQVFTEGSKWRGIAAKVTISGWGFFGLTIEPRFSFRCYSISKQISSNILYRL